MTSGIPDHPRRLSVVAAGHPEPSAIENLRKVLDHLELIETNLDPAGRFSAQQAQVNRAIDAAANDWILLLRQHERVTPQLAGEIAETLIEAPRAWGFRCASETYYAGERLHLEPPMQPELRLLHRRHARFRDGAEFVQGTVVRTKNPITRESFASVEDHETFLAEGGVPHSFARALLIVVRNAIATKSFFRRNDLRYLWHEAKWDRGATR
jgi:hypothetical protein